jgi:hypothetical protein
MRTTTVGVLKDAITRLEKELERHRRALQVIEGRESVVARVSRRKVQPAPKQRSNNRATTKKRSRTEKPQRAKSMRGGEKPSTRVLVERLLSDRAPRMLTPSEIARELSQQGHTVDASNVQRRLSEMVKTKAVIRKEGRYRAPE